MIIFKKITWKNFLSTGNVQSEVNLNEHASTIITGTNGEGKSTILDALTFALFGKPFRKVKKGMLVNSINGKNCTVSIEFNVGAVSYRVVRGIAPVLFEIYQNDILINKDADARDYQKVLEQQILKLNYKTFTQVVILGSATFKPFMELSASDRREVTEDILDIRIFTVMNSLLKVKLAKTVEQINYHTNKIESYVELVAAQKKLIKTMTTSKQEMIDSITGKIQDHEEKIAEIQDDIKRLEEEKNELQAKYPFTSTEISDKISQAEVKLNKISSDKRQAEADIKFFDTNHNCPACDQSIQTDHKDRIIDEKRAELIKYDDIQFKGGKALERLKSLLSEVQANDRKISNITSEVFTHNNTISTLSGIITSLKSDSDKVVADTGNIDAERAKIQELAGEAKQLINTKNELLKEKQIQESTSKLLKDTGIKTAIIREYLPIMNKLINKYLAAMEFYVSFELDESFNEVIRSRNRDMFTYASFSEGEKRRFDLAILFTWRQIARMKNSANTNLLVMDEIIDGALDTAGMDYVLSILNTFGEEANIFLISPKADQIIDKFDACIKAEKVNEFSVISYQ